MNHFEILLNSKYCKEKGYYIKRVVAEDIDDENFLDFASPIRFGYSNKSSSAEYLTPSVRTKGNSIRIELYGIRDIEVDDLIRIDNKFYHVEDINQVIETKGMNKAYHYFITLKWWKEQLMVY